MSNEIIIKSNQQAGFIEFNYEEIKTTVLEQIKPYQNLVVTTENFDDMKKTRAKLNGVIKQVENKRKEIKKDYSTPLTAFEKQVKEIVQIFQKESDNINHQIKLFEEQEKIERQNQIHDYFRTLENHEYVEIGYIFDERWLNKTYTEKKWKEELEKELNRVYEDIKYLDSLNAENTAVLFNAYYTNGLSIVQATKTYNEFMERVKAKEELRLKIEKEKQKQSLENNSSSDRLYTRSFQVIDATLEDLQSIEELLSTRKIKYRKVV